MSKMKNDSIMIDIGFDSNIDSFIKETEAKLKKANFGGENINAEVSKAIKQVSTDIDELNNKKIKIDFDGDAFVKTMASLENIKNTLDSDIEANVRINTKNISGQFEDLTVHISDFKAELGDLSKGFTLNESFDVTELEKYINGLRQIQTFITKVVEHPDLSLEKKDFDLLGSVLGIDIDDVNAASIAVDNKLQKISQLIKTTLSSTLTETKDANDVPLYLRVSTSKEVLIEQVKQVINAVKQYAKNNSVPIKVDLTTEYQSKAMKQKIKEFTNLLPQIDDDNIRQRVEQLSEEIGKNFTQGWSIRINTDEMKTNIDTAEGIIKELVSAVEDANKKLVLNPEIDFSDKVVTKLYEKIKKINQSIENSSEGTVIQFKGNSETTVFAKQLDEIVAKFQELAKENTSLKEVKNTFNSLSNLANKLNNDDFKKSGVVGYLEELKKAIAIPSSGGIGDQFKILIENSDKIKAAADALKAADASLGELTGKEYDLNIDDEDIAYLDSFASSLSAFVVQFGLMQQMLKDNTLSKGLNNFITTLNTYLPQLDTSTISPLANLTESFNLTDEDKESIEQYISDIQELTNKLGTATKNIRDYNKALDDNKFNNDKDKFNTIAKNIDKINIKAEENGVLSVLLELLEKGSELDKLITLFTSPFGATVNRELLLPEMNIEEVASNNLEAFYNKASGLKNKLSIAIDTQNITDVEDLYRELSKVSNLYWDLRTAKNKGIISKEDFDEASSYLSEINSELTQLSGFKMPSLKTKRLGMGDLSENKQQFKEYIRMIDDEATLEQQRIQELANQEQASLEQKKNAIESFNASLKELSTAAGESMTENENADKLVESLTNVKSTYEDIKKLAETGIINQEELDKATNSYDKITNDIIELSNAKNQSRLDILGNTDEVTSDVSRLNELIQTLFKELRAGASAETLAPLVNEFDALESKLSKQQQDFILYMNIVDELKSSLIVLPDLQDQFFNAKTAGKKEDSLQLFAGQLERIIELYKVLDNLDVSLSDEGKKDAEQLKEQYQKAFIEITQGFGRHIDKIKKNITLSDANADVFNKLFGDKTFLDMMESGNFSATAMEEWADKVNIALKSIGSDASVRGNALTYQKILGKIYNDLIKNSNASSEWKKQMRALADEMKSMGEENSSKLITESYASRYQQLNTQLKESGKVGKNFFGKLSDNMKHQTTQLIAMTFSFYRLIGVMRSGFNTATEFNSALAKISYTMDVSDKQISAMGNSILGLSKELKTSVSNIQDAYTIYANMNTSPEEIENLTKYTAVLSNLSGIDASTAADDIQAVVNQFENLNSTDTSHIVDVFDFISRNISVDYQKGIEGMAEGVQAVGNVADQAGLSYEQLSAIIAKTMEQTRNSGSSIANGLKTIMVRLSKASSMSDEVDNSTLSKASSVLHDIGVEVYTAAGEYREFDTIMTELASKWDSLTQSQQANISFQIAATRQTATLKAILQNWTSSMELATDATNTQGNALENQEKYADTYAAKVQEIKNAFDEFAITTFNSDSFKEFLDFTKDGIVLVTELADKVGALGVALAGLATIGVTKKMLSIGDLTDVVKGLSVSGQGITTALSTIQSLGDGSDINDYADALEDLNSKQVKVVLSSSKLDKATKQLVLSEYAARNATIAMTETEALGILTTKNATKVENKLSETQIKSLASSIGKANAEGVLTKVELERIVAEHKLDEALAQELIEESALVGVEGSRIPIISALSTATKGFAASLGLTVPQLALVAAGIITVVGVVKMLKDAYVTQSEYSEKLTESIENMQEAVDELDSLNKELDETKNRISELQKQANDGTISLVDQEELTKLKETNKELERKIALQKTSSDKEIKDAFEEARKNPSEKYKGYEYTEIEQALNEIEKARESVDKTSSDSLTESITNTLEAYKRVKEDVSEMYDKVNNKEVSFEDNTYFDFQDEQLDAMKSQLIDNMDLLEQKKEAYDSWIDSGKTFNEKQQKEYDEIIETERNYFKQMYAITGDETYFDAMAFDDQFEIFRQNVIKRITEAYGADGNFVATYLEGVFNEIKEKGVIPKDFDLSKLESANISAQMFKMSDGVSFAFDTSNVSEEEKQGLEEHVKSLYAQAKAKVEAEGKTVNHNTILEAMLVLDDTGLDYIDNYVEQVTNYVEQAFQEQGNAVEPKVSFEDAWAALDDLSSDDPLSGFKEEVTKLAEEGKLSKENFLKIDGAKTWADKLNIDLDEALRKMNELSKDTDRLSNFKGVVSKLQNAYSEKRDAVLTNKDATKQNEKLNQVEAVSASTMADLEKEFGHLDSWKKYKETLGSVTSTTDECLKATNDLLTEYYNLGKVINEVVDSTGEVDKATRDYYISQLDELGIANAEEVIDEEIFKRQVELKLSKLNLKDATDEEIQMTMSEIEALDDESVSAEYAMNTINALVKQKLTAGKTSLSNSEDISYLNDLITNAKLAGYNVDKLIQAKLDLQNAASIGSGGASVKDFLTKRGNESYQDWLDDDAVEQQIKISTKKPKKNNGGNNGGGGGGNSTKKDATEFIDWIARHLEEVNHKIESEKIKLENTFGEKARHKIYKNIDKYWKDNIKANKIGAKKYTDSYKGFLKDNKKKLGKNLINKIENGDITGSYKQLIKEYGESTAKLINEGIRRRKLALEAQDEVGKSITSRRNDRIQELQEHADNRQAKSDLYRLRSEKTEEGYKKQNYWLEKAKGQEKASLNIQMDIAKIQKDKTKQLEIQEKLNKLNNQYAAEEFDIMQESYDRKKDLIQDRISLAQSLIDLAAARGAKASIDYYQDIINIDNELIKQNKNNIRDAKEALKGLTYNSKEYEEKLKQIHTLEIEGNNLLADKAQQTKNIVDTYTGYVDALREGNNLISEELNFVDGLGDRYKHTSEEVKNFYTEAGNAALVVNAKNIEISKENQDILKKSYDSLLSAFNDPNRIATLMSGQSIYVNVVDRNTRKVTKLQINSYDQLKEYVKKYYSDLRGEVKAQYDYENKLIDLKKEQYTEELNLVKKLIDAKKEELDAEKDLHDYQRTISEKATNITNLERQLAAYSGNTSEEGRAKLQSLQQQLKEAQEDLNETEYDRYISDQKNMLEGLQKEYEEAIQKILDDPERLLKEAQEDVKNGFADANKFLSEILEKYDYTPEYQKSVLTRMNDLKEEMRNQEHAITEASGLLSKLGSDNGGAGKEANTGLTDNSEYKPKSGGSNNSKSNTNKKASEEKGNNPIGTRDGLIKAIKKIVDNKKYQKKDTKNISEVNKLIYKKYKKALTTTGLKQVAEILGVPYSKEKNSKLWKSLKDLGFSKGGIAKLIKKNGDDGIATLKRGEAVLTPLQTKQFAILANNLKNINQLMEAQSRMANIAELQSRLNESINDFYNSARDVSYGDITFEFNLPNVTDSKQFIYAIQNDVKVQKAIQSVTIDQIYKQSTLYSSKLKSKSIK